MIPEREQVVSDESLMRMRVEAEDKMPDGSVTLWSRNLLFILDEIKRQREALREIEIHHVNLNARIGRSEALSNTLRLARNGLGVKQGA